MKGKLTSKIKSSSRLIDRFKINEAAADESTRTLFQNLVVEYNEAINSQGEIKSLRKELKLKEKDFKKSIAKLSKKKSAAKKALKGSYKSPVEAIKAMQGTMDEPLPVIKEIQKKARAKPEKDIAS